jgi:putative pyruvate formate lyase activating enzyme
MGFVKERKCRPAVRALWDRMNPCILCPRKCKVNRSRRTDGFCGVTQKPKVSSSGPHFGEESVLVGPGGSGTIFFSGCNLGCVFCQNYEISHHRLGSKCSVEELAASMLLLQGLECSNINLVTPTHFAAPIAEAIDIARKKGLKLPIVYNTGGYDSVETLKLLKGYINIYMPDMKYSSSKVAKELSGAPDYPRINRLAVKEMHRQVGDLKTKNGLATRGLLVRHLVLPNKLAGSFKIIDFLVDEISPKTTINIMDQYHPCYEACSNPKINHRPTEEEVESVRQYAIESGLKVLD